MRFREFSKSKEQDVLEDLNSRYLPETIRKLPNGKYRLYSHKGGNLGTFDSHDAAEKHERQVQYFKHQK